ncbi:MAG: metallophosphoesterase [Armatimonas sp.]
MKKALAWGAVLGGAAAGALAYALKVEPYLVEATETTLHPPRLPESWNGLRVLFLSDPHVCEFGQREEKVLSLIGEREAPELILWGGDFLGTVDSVDQALKFVEAVRAKFPTVPMYAVPGNSEHKPGKKQRERLYTGLRALDIALLINEWEPLTLRGETITLAGCDDAYYGWADLDKTFEGAPQDRFTLLLSHSPQVAAIVANTADLMLSGHTHGGQVRVPGFGAIKTQNPLSRRLDMGVFDREKLAAILGEDPGGDMLTFVGRGIGVATLSYAAWFAPRFLCRPEVAYLTLSR